MQTETLKKLYNFLKKNDVDSFQIRIVDNDMKIIIDDLGIDATDSIEIFEEGTQDLIYLNSSKLL